MVSEVTLATSWADNTEVQVAQQGSDLTDGWLDGIYILKAPLNTTESWFYAWDAANPDLSADPTPDVILRIPPRTEDNRDVFKLTFPGGLSFTLGLAWFLGETAGDFGVAVTTINIPLIARVYYRKRA